MRHSIMTGRRLLAVAALASMMAASGNASAAEKVTYLLPAPEFLPAFAPWMIAKNKGYYAAEGLDVTFQRARGGVDVAKQVGVGNAPIGGGIGDTSIIVRANGVPVKSVGLLGGGSLVQLAVRADSGVKKPKDLRGKTITVLSFQDTTFYAVQGILASQGLTRNDVNLQAAGPTGVWKMFLSGETHAMAAVPDWLGIAYGNKIKMVIFPADDYFPSMAQAILASDDMIEKNPGLVGKLVRATLSGLAEIMKDPAAAAKDYVKAVPQHKGKEGAMAAVFRLYNKYTYPGQKVLGEMDEAKLAKLQDFYFEQGFIRKKSPVKELYTNQFVGGGS